MTENCLRVQLPSSFHSIAAFDKKCIMSSLSLIVTDYICSLVQSNIAQLLVAVACKYLLKIK